MTIVQAFIWGRDSLVVCRLLIGTLEAGFYPTAVIYLASFYRRYDLASRLAFFYAQYAIASAFSGALGGSSLSLFLHFISALHSNTSVYLTKSCSMHFSQTRMLSDLCTFVTLADSASNY
jgi:MFS family permease